MSSKHQVAKAPANALAAYDNELAVDSEKFAPKFRSADLVVPRLKILQSMSPQLKKSDAAYVEEADEGDFFIQGSGQLFKGDDGLLIIPIEHTISAIEWKTTEKGGGIVQDHGTNDLLEKQATRDEKGRSILPNGNQIVVSDRYFLLIPKRDDTEEDLTAVFDLKATQRKKARGWNSILNAIRHTREDGSKIQPPFFYSAFTLTPVAEQNAAGQSYMGVRIDPAGKTLELPNGPVLYAAARKLREMIAAEQVGVQPEEGQAGEAGQGHSEPAPY